MKALEGSPYEILLQQIRKPIILHNYKKRHINIGLRGTYSLYFFCLITKKYYDTTTKMYYGLLNMTKNVLGNCSFSSEKCKQIDTSPLVQNFF